MISGLLLALGSGLLVGLQNIFNSRLNERAGAWQTTTWVLGLGFLASLGGGLVIEGAAMFDWHAAKPWYWFSGLLGVAVVFCLTQSMRLLKPTYAVAIVLSAQLGSAIVWDTLGWFGLTQAPMSATKLAGVLLIIGGVILLKTNGRIGPRRLDQTETRA